jgi:hypothetical protein
MRSRAIYVLPLVGALFLIGFIVNVANHDVTLGNSVIQLAIAVIGLSGFAFVRHEQRQRTALVAYLIAHRDDVRAGTARYRDVPISYATRIREYDVVVSLLIVSLRFPSRPVIVGTESGRAVRIGCTVVSLVLGWWGFPHGPLWTIRALVRNVRGTLEITIGELLEGKADGVVPTATAR